MFKFNVDCTPARRLSPALSLASLKPQGEGKRDQVTRAPARVRMVKNARRANAFSGREKGLSEPHVHAAAARVE